MKPSQAFRLAIQCLQGECQRLAVDANYHDIFKSENPSAVNASNRRKQLREAEGILRKLIKPDPNQQSQI